MNPKERIEREKISQYQHGVLAIYPEQGSTEGGNIITFIHSPANAAVTFSSENYGGCKIGEIMVPVSGVTKCILIIRWLYYIIRLLIYMDAFYLVHCRVPAHSVGTVEPILIVDGEERFPFPGTISYNCILLWCLQMKD